MAEHWRVFSKDWFLAHQRRLLWLLNFPPTKRWVRYLLRIRPFDCALQERITQIGPNYYSVALPNGALRYDFRTHAKFAKRIYYAFKPLWWTMHWWDAIVADRALPRLSFGFSPLTFRPDPYPETTSVDGYALRYGVNETWAQIIARAGNWANHDGDNLVFQAIASSTSGQWERMYRNIVLFDTSPIGDGVTIQSAVLSVYGDYKINTLVADPDMNVYTSNPASETAVESADYGSLGAVAQSDSPITYTNWLTSGYNSFALNATGLGNISKVAVTKFGLRNANYDVAQVAPPWVSGQQTQMRGYSADRTGTNQDPKLVVTEAPPPPPPFKAAGPNRRLMELVLGV